MSKHLTLWRIELNQPIALFDASVIEVLQAANETTVPFCHEYMNTIVHWRETWVPVFRLNRSDQTLLICHTSKDSESPYIALACSASPTKIKISDSDFSEQGGDQFGFWQQATLSAVRHQNRTIPILNPALFYGESFLKAVSSECKFPSVDNRPTLHSSLGS